MPRAKKSPTGKYALEEILRQEHNKNYELVNAIGHVVDMRLVQNGVVGGNYTLGPAGAATTLALSGRVRYRIAGVEYECALPATATLQDRGDITQAKYGAWAVLIDATGAVTTQDTGEAMAYDSGEDALLNLAARANTADTVCIGYLTITKSDAAFNIGTTNLNAANTTVALYYVSQPLKQASGIITALVAAPSGNAGAATLNVGAVTVKRNGLKLAEVAANATLAFSDANVVTTAKYGGWLLVTDLAGTGFYVLAADAQAGTASTMAYNTSALAQAALDNLVDRLPALFVPIGQIILTKTGGDFTAGTTNTNATGVTATYTKYLAGTHNRSDTAGATDADAALAGTHRVTPPTLPTVAASCTEDVTV